jgi:phosphopantetheinyl transferase
MPFINAVNIDHINLHIWDVAEDEAFFIKETAAVDLSQLSNYRHPQARLQWLASRMLLLKILGIEQYKRLYKNEKGKILLDDSNLNISISHSDNLVAVAISEKQFGIDIQKYTDKIPLVSSKFIPEETLSIIKELPGFGKICHVHWGVKEALFKAYENGGLDYRKNLILDWDNSYCNEGTNFVAHISKNNINTHFNAQYSLILGHFILCTVTKF